MELSTRQHGVISTRQLARLGYTRSSAAKAARVGRLERLHKGVYAVGHTKLTWHSHCMAAVLACRPSVASHTAAGWLWGLLPYQPETPHLTAPTSRHPRRGFVVHRALLARADMTGVEGIPATAVPRTLLDLAAMLSDARLQLTIERAEKLRLLDLGPIEELLGRASHHPGAVELRRGLDIYVPEQAVLRSNLEKRFRGLVREAGLPEPSMNYVVGGLELDVYWERERFVVELDVFETHGTCVAFERDRERQDDLLLAGIEMIRVTGPRLEREPSAVMHRVAAHLERRRRDLGQ